jgi:M6 family metalloprotease-like protein
MKSFLTIRLNLFLVGLILCSFTLRAAPFHGTIMSFPQPDGTMVDVRLFGTEYYIRAEGLDNYTVIRDPSTRYICYASLSANGMNLVSTGEIYRGTRINAASLKSTRNQPFHLALPEEKVQKIVAQNKSAIDGGRQEKMDPYPVLGHIKGLTIVIDFADAPATIPLDSYVSLCNDPDYTEYGNNGSLRSYYQDISGGKLDYENEVFGIFRAEKTFAHYDSLREGEGATEIMHQALEWIDEQGFDFSTLSLNADKGIRAINIIYTGYPKDWAQGMWWHQGTYTGFSADGVHTTVYNCSNAYEPLSIGTIVHENGHMLGNWADTYKYTDLYGPDGIGTFDLMCNYADAFNPVPPNPFYLINAGWENAVDISAYNGPVTDDPDDFTSYVYLNQNDTNEFFILENRMRVGRSAHIPDEGLTIWHIDRKGENQSFHHEVYLVHANGDIEANEGICFHEGFVTDFNEQTDPGTDFYDTNPSGLSVSSVGQVQTSLDFFVGLTETVPRLVYSFLGYEDKGNLNGIPDPGEEGIFRITIKNTGLATSLHTTGHCTSTQINGHYLDVPDDPVDAGDLEPGQSVVISFPVFIHEDAFTGYTTNLHFSITNQLQTQTFDQVFAIGRQEKIGTPEIQTCDCALYDNGGPYRNYSDETDLVTRLVPDTENRFIRAEFAVFNTETDDNCGYDYLEIFDGPSVESPLIGKYCGNDIPTSLVSTDPGGALTFHFHSDEAVSGEGFKVFITCSEATITRALSSGQPLEVFPNPSGDGVFVRTSFYPGDNLLLLTNNLGIVVRSIYAPSGLNYLSVKDLPSGIYMLELLDNQRRIGYGKIIVP